VKKDRIENVNNGQTGQNQVKKPEVVLAENTISDKLTVQPQTERKQEHKPSLQEQQNTHSLFTNILLGICVGVSNLVLLAIFLAALFGGGWSGGSSFHSGSTHC
jgi:hypothetical protein